MEKRNELVRYRYRFYGRVQRVGFRFTAQYYAKNLGLTGFVRNEYDGSVTMEVQGRELPIRELVEKLYGDLYIRIEEEEKERMEPDERERKFSVR